MLLLLFVCEVQPKTWLWPLHWNAEKRIMNYVWPCVRKLNSWKFPSWLRRTSRSGNHRLSIIKCSFFIFHLSGSNHPFFLKLSLSLMHMFLKHTSSDRQSLKLKCFVLFLSSLAALGESGSSRILLWTCGVTVTKPNCIRCGPGKNEEYLSSAKEPGL